MSNWEEATREEVSKLIGETIGDLLPHLPYFARNFMIATTICGAMVKFTANVYEWEYDLGIGTKRFRDKRCGPWTSWKPIEA